MLGSDFGSGQVFWSMLWFFLFFIWIMLLFTVFADIFRSQDLSGWGKALWSIFVIIVPYLGVFVYLIAQGRGMGERALRRIEQQRVASDAYIRSVAAQTEDEQLAKARELLRTGAITPDEFQRLVPSVHS